MKKLSFSFRRFSPNWTARLVLLGLIAVGFLLWWRERPRDPTPFVLTRMQVCYENGENNCYQETATELHKQFAIPDILRVFAEEEQVPAVFSRCHEVTHYLGRMTFAEKGSIRAAYDGGSAVCHGGFYHGVIEGYFDAAGQKLFTEDDAFFRGLVPTTCGKPEEYAKPALFGECLHGIGHAAMFVTDGDLPRSLALCDALPDTSGRETCYSGVFMENSSSSTSLDHPSKYVRGDNPMYPCSILADQYLKLCYTYQSSYFAILTHQDWQMTTALCEQVPAAFRGQCFHTIGTNQVGFTQDMTKMNQDCQYASDSAMRESCVVGVADALVGRYNTEFSRVSQFCSQVADEHKKACYQQMIASIKGWMPDPAAIEGYCRVIPREYEISDCAGVS